MESLNWKFRKSLQSINTYNQSKFFKNQIQKGNKQIINLVIRQIQIILSEPNQEPFVKFQSLRFCKDILLVGNALVISTIQRLVPLLIKICSYKLQSKDPNRGNTYFQTHPSYLKSKPQQKENLKLVGASFLIFSLQSIKIWASWIPVNQNGNESVFKKAYDNLLQRGVSFCNECQYYKKTDQQKFNKTYKVQFFETSDIMDQEHSQFNQNSILIIQLQKMKGYKQSLINLLLESRPSLQQLQSLKGKILKFHNISTQQIQRNIELNSENEYQQKKNLQLLYEEQVWSQNFLKNYNMLINKKISFDDFCKIYIRKGFSKQKKSSQVMISSNQKQLPSQIKLKVEQFKINEKITEKWDNQKQNNLKKAKNMNLNIVNSAISPKNSANNFNSGSKQTQTLLRQQKMQYQNKINELQIQINGKNVQLRNMRQQNLMNVQKIRRQYEDRIKSIKQKTLQIKKNDNLVIQNKQLNDRMRQLKNQNQKYRLQIQRLMKGTQKQDLLEENKRLQDELNKLKSKLTVQIDNKNIIIQNMGKQSKKQLQLINSYRIQIQNDKVLKQRLQYENVQLRKQLNNQRQQKQILFIESKKYNQEIEKLKKQKINMLDQLTMYKQQLNNTRNKGHLIRDNQVERLQQNNKKLKNQLQQHKTKVLQILKNNDNKDIQIIKLSQEKLILQKTIQQLQYQKSKLLSPQNKIQYSQPKTLQNFYKTNQNPHQFTKSPFKNTQQKQTPLLLSQYAQFFVKLPKQSYLRFCKSSLKSKDLLYKQNQFQIGLISQKVSPNKIKFILHFTNNSQFLLKDFKVKVYSPKNIKTTIITQGINNIQSLQQQKYEIVHEIINYPLRKVNIEINYQKNHKKQITMLLLPVVILKYCDYFKPTNYKQNLVDSRQFKYSTKIIPSAKNLQTYFNEIRQITPNLVYDIEINHRQSQLLFYLKFIFNNHILMFQAHTQTLNNIQKQILTQYLNSLQFVLSK